MSFKMHAYFTYDDTIKTYYIQDEASRNGTFLNGTRLSKVCTTVNYLLIFMLTKKITIMVIVKFHSPKVKFTHSKLNHCFERVILECPFLKKNSNSQVTMQFYIYFMYIPYR